MGLLKKKRVFFIGSGPSCGMGLPSVNELCRLAIDPNFLDPHPMTWFQSEPKEEIKTLENALRVALQYFFPSLTLDKINFEEALTVLEESGIGPEISGISRGNVSGSAEFPFNLNQLKRELISSGMRALGERFDVLSNKENESYKPTPAFKSWKKAYASLNSPSSEYEDIVITTNYDLVIENALLGKYIYSTYLPERTLILKLHGSMNWHKLEHNVFFSEIREGGRLRALDYKDEEVLDYVNDSRVIASYPKSEVASDNPVIITPHISKTYSDSLFKRIWWLATKVLADAEELVILGYSFSGNDFYVKKLIELALNSWDSKINKIYHFDKDSKVKDLFEPNLGDPMGPMRRRRGVLYRFREIDFSQHCPNFEDLAGDLVDVSRI